MGPGRYRGCCRDAVTNPNAESYANTNSDACCMRAVITNAHRNTYCDGDSHCHSYSYSYSYSDSDGYSYRHGHGNTDTQREESYTTTSSNTGPSPDALIVR